MLMLEAGPQLRARDRDADVPDARPGAAARHIDARQGIRLLRRDRRRRLAGSRRAVFERVADESEQQFWWWRARMLGGRTNHWGRISLRNGPYDFKPHSRDGLGFDWPIDYEDVAPYYDKVEMLIGVYGDNDGLENTPNSSPGCLLPPPKPRAGELLIAQRAKKLGMPVIAAHRAVLTQQLDHKTFPPLLHPGNERAQKILAEQMRSRAACFWATRLRPRLLDPRELSVDDRASAARARDRQSRHPHATRWCAKSSSTRTATPPASSSSTRRPARSSARRRASSCWPRARARPCASCSTRSPRGSRKGSRTRAARSASTSWTRSARRSAGQIPVLENLPPHNEDGAGGIHVYAPWWLYKEQHAGKLDFARGYHIEMGSGRRMPSVGTHGLDWPTFAGSYGRKLKEDTRRYYGSFVGLSGRGEMIPNEDSYCEIDPQVKDRWGIPVLRFHWKWSEHETRQAAHMQKTFAAIIEAMGGRVLGQSRSSTAARRSRRAATSSTRSAARSWARTRRPRS